MNGDEPAVVRRRRRPQRRQRGCVPPIVGLVAVVAAVTAVAASLASGTQTSADEQMKPFHTKTGGSGSITRWSGSTSTASDELTSNSQIASSRRDA